MSISVLGDSKGMDAMGEEQTLRFPNCMNGQVDVSLGMYYPSFLLSKHLVAMVKLAPR